MNKIGIIGMGHVGSEVAYNLVKSSLVSNLVLIDRDEKKANAEKLELEDAMYFTRSTVAIATQKYDLLKDATVIVISVGELCKDSDNRLSELEQNQEIIKQIIPKIIATGFNGIFLVITNPCDVITMLVQKLSGFPKSRVIGTGTLLDTMRMHRVVADTLKVSSKAIEGYTLGEHGESQFVSWSTVRLGGVPVTSLPEFSTLDLNELKRQVRAGGWEIFKYKHWTNYGIATATERVISAILNDEKMVFPLSNFDEVEQTYISFPVILGRKGIVTRIPLQLTEKEQQEYSDSAKVIKSAFNKINFEI